MKKLLLIFLLFPLLVFGQAEKTHRSIIIDSLKAFNGGIIDAKDTVNFEKPLKGSVLRFTDDVTGLKTLAELAASEAGDSSFVEIQVDNIRSFLGNKITFDSTAIFNKSVGIGTSTPSAKLHIKGKDATSSNFGLIVTDNVNTDLFNVRNDGNIGMSQILPFNKLDITVNKSDLDLSSPDFSVPAIRLRNIAGTTAGIRTTTIYQNFDKNLGEFGMINTGGLNGDFIWLSRIDGGGVWEEKMRVSNLRNVLGLRNSDIEAWSAHNFVIESIGSSIYFGTVAAGSAIELLSNAYYDGAFKYKTTNKAAALQIFGGKHLFTVAPSGTINTVISWIDAMTIDNSGNVGVNQITPTAKLHIIGDVIVDSLFSIPTKIDTLGVGVTTFVVRGNKMKMTGDGGGNTITTITGGINGLTLTLTFTDALITLTDDNTSTVNTINLSAAFTSTANDVVVLESDGTSWREVSRSIN